ncbi:DUF1345 domain-containing protein [Hymenobacter sp. DH14]|uniref:DUF1345 domain-containing protein n=1 Tax=Hymenobacter cyanobacteriorum TaxID=2926463 RepID=A0A9X2AHI7_9BACT|nr:DUF1345 domain-containing protein [Hymenobacter cyanobacteriorum]MCI1186669.1 DUF1345 domain-containing protein [Hymenobacter cyanobacteriorum]
MSQKPAAAPDTTPEKTPAELIRSLDVRWRLGLALLVGGLAAWLLPLALAPWVPSAEIGPLARTVMGWVGFGAADLVQVLLGMWEADTEDIRCVAGTEDLPRTVGFVLVLGAAIASLGAVVGLLRSLDKLPAHVCMLHVVLSVAAVVLAWLLVHLVFTLRYAHTYYDKDEATGRDVGGLVFPDDQDGGKPKLKPNYIDFAYFSFVIGMTAQTADIAIANRELRGVALLHGCVSFLFNTVIVALTIGTVGGLLN